MRRRAAPTPAPTAAAHGRGVDFCVLGYRHEPNGVAPRLVDLGGVLVYDRLSVLGGHCYAVTAAGARRLLRAALPIQLHVDVWLGLLMEVGAAAGYAWPESLAAQCDGRLEQRIGHADWAVGAKKLLPDVPVRTAVVRAPLLTALCAVLLAAALRQKRKTDAGGDGRPAGAVGRRAR